MKRIFLLFTALAVTLVFGTPAVYAQHGSGHPGGAPGGVGGGPGTGGPGMGGASMANPGMGNSGMHGNGTMNGQGMETQSVSHSSPTSLLSSNPKLSSTLQTRLGSLLPAGTSMTDAADGFKNLGEFVAALHVSHNLGISFDDLKGKMTGGESLGKAIKDLKPDVNSKAEAKKANRQAKEDIEESKS